VIPSDWEPYQRDDGELIGYLAVEEDDLVVPVNLVGHPIGDAMERLEAEELLEAAGLSYLAEPWLLRHDDGTEQRVVIVEVDADRVVVTDAQFALVVGRPTDMIDRVTLSVPTDRLRPA
jgi:ABC-type arginine transport system ATPase subunit